MIETIINYHSEYLEDEQAKWLLFAWRGDQKDYFRSPEGVLLKAGGGMSCLVQGRFIAMLTVFVVPVLYWWVEEKRMKVR